MDCWDPQARPIGVVWVCLCLIVFVASITAPHECDHAHCPHKPKEEVRK